MVFDNPPPVGFSWCSPAGPSGDGYSCGNWDDAAVAKANLFAMLDWSSKFPEYSSNKLYLVGESYAGVYVPTVAQQLVTNPLAKGINLAGIAVGDPCFGLDILCGPGLYPGPYHAFAWAYGKGQISNIAYNEVSGLSCCFLNLFF